eukprot:1986388-Amphidinium_carterae.1
MRVVPWSAAVSLHAGGAIGQTLQIRPSVNRQAWAISPASALACFPQSSVPPPASSSYLQHSGSRITARRRITGKRSLGRWRYPVHRTA